MRLLVETTWRQLAVHRSRDTRSKQETRDGESLIYVSDVEFDIMEWDKPERPLA